MGGWRAAGAVLALVVAGCGGDPAPLQAAVDGLSLPASWAIARTVVKGGPSPCLGIGDPYCPSVTRYYLVSGALPDLFQVAKDAVEEDFTDVQGIFPSCDLKTNGSLCSINGAKGNIHIEVNLYRPGDDVDSLGIANPDRVTIRFVVRGG